MDAPAFASLGPGQLRAGSVSDAIDDYVPQAVVTVRSREHVEAALAEAARGGAGVIVSGGATSVATGNIPRNFDMRIVTTGLGAVLEVKAEDMTVTAQSGATLARVNRALAKVGQRLVLDPAFADRTTIGGLVATNRTGGLRYGFGTPRDLVLGMDVVDGKLRSYRAGGRVVKNVAGFDLCRLFTGSRGTLAVITEVTLRTHPIPPAAGTALFDFETAESLDTARARIFDSNLPLAALDFAVDVMDGRASWTLAARAEGTEGEVTYQIERLCELVGAEPGAVDGEWWSPAHADGEAAGVIRLDMAPSQIVAATDRVAEATGKDVPTLTVGGHLGDGTARFSVSEAVAVGRVLDAACQVAKSAADGSFGHPAKLGRVVVEKAPAGRKRGIDVWDAGADDGKAGAQRIGLMRALKERFDPNGILAPGRFTGGL